MSLSYFLDFPRLVLRVVGHGSVSIDDRVRFFDQLQADPSLPTDIGVLVDVNAVTSTPTVEEVAVIGRLAGKLLAQFSGRIAIVNTTVGHVTISHLVGLSVGESWERVRVCSSEAAALDWIGS